MDTRVVAVLFKEGGKVLTSLLQSYIGRLPQPIHLGHESEPRKETKGLTTEETINYQKREIAKQLTLLEGHLQQSCKINNKACDCCTKHPITIEGLAEETTGMTQDPIFRELAGWAKLIAPITTEAASASGKYDEEYPKLAIRAREFRKAIMPVEKEV
jgi:hypothetical protein